MSDFIFYLKMPSYLRQWLVHRHSGSEPLVLNSGSPESKLVKKAQSKPPKDFVPSLPKADELAICIPYSKARDPRTYNYLSPTAKAAFLDMVKNDFCVDCWRFLNDFGHIGRQQKMLIYLYMEQRGIKDDGTCWDAIAKQYQRLRKNAQSNDCKKRKRQRRAAQSKVSEAAEAATADAQ